MTDELNGQALTVHRTNPYKNYNFQNDGTSRFFGLWLWKLVHLLNFIHVFDQTLAEQLYRDKGLFGWTRVTPTRQHAWQLNLAWLEAPLCNVYFFFSWVECCMQP